MLGRRCRRVGAHQNSKVSRHLCWRTNRPQDHFPDRDSQYLRDAGHYLALVLLAELERDPHPAQALIFDQISFALGAHLLRGYNASEPAINYGSSSLGWRDLARLTEFIEDNIDRSIGLADPATIVSVSKFHLARIFKRSTRMTAISFVVQCRLRRDQSLISDTSHSLAKIALMTGFADQSTLRADTVGASEIRLLHSVGSTAGRSGPSLHDCHEMICVTNTGRAFSPKQYRLS